MMSFVKTWLDTREILFKNIFKYLRILQKYFKYLLTLKNIKNIYAVYF